MPNAQAGGEYEREMTSSRQGATMGLPQKNWISRVSEKQSEALLRLFSRTILKVNRPFFIFSHNIFHPSS